MWVRGRVGGSRAGRHAGRWAGGLITCLLLAFTTPAVGQQAAPTAAAAPRTYAECLRTYVGRVDPATYCRRLFPANAPDATAPAGATQTTTTPGATREPVDITPQLEKLIESWANRPKPPVKPPADPLAVVPGIQAACAPYAGNAERWLRCTADGWRRTGLRGQPPLVLQTPPTPPVVVATTDPAPVEPSPVKPAPVRSEPPVQVQPDPPVEVAPPVAPLASKVKSEPALARPADPPLPPKIEARAIPSWAWLLAAVVALLAAGAGGFGLSRWLARPRTSPTQPAQAQAAPHASAEIALVADPGVVTLIPDGPPRAGLAVSMRVTLDTDPDADAVRLEPLALEVAP